jgi:hypothetical protein
MICHRCETNVSNTYRLIDVDGNAEWLCKPCLWDEHHAASKGQLPQDPDADVRPRGWDEPGAYR